jgi:hypothetical protein
VPTVSQGSFSVKSKGRPGRPLLRTPAKERQIIRACVQSAIVTGQMPRDTELAQQTDLGERTVRTIRLEAGLSRWDVSTWVKARTQNLPAPPAGETLCWSSYGGVWLLTPLLVRSTLLKAAGVLQWTTQSGVAAGQWVLTVVLWAVLNFRRFWHLTDFRHQADLGLALFTGRLRLLADSTMWRLVHSLTPDSAEAFYQQTAAEAVPLEAPIDQEWLSMDEHVVGFFTKLKPRPLGKTRVPTRGRPYPAIRLYAPFHLWAGRFVGLLVTRASRALSQELPALITELRTLRRRANHPRPEQVDVIVDRGAYKGVLFKQLMEDCQLRFIAMARATPANVRQWAAVREEAFAAYQPAGEKNSQLKIAETETKVAGCPYPLRTVLIRDDTPSTRQRWRCLFTKVTADQMTPAKVDETYRKRQHQEDGFAQLDHSLAGKCLPKPYRLLRQPNHQGQKRKTVATELSPQTMTGLKVVAWLRHWTFNLVHDFGAALGGPYASMKAGTLVRKFIARPGILRVKGNEFWVSLMPFVDSEALTGWLDQVNQQRIEIPWLGHLVLHIEVAALPVGLAADPDAARKRIFANRTSPTAT